MKFSCIIPSLLIAATSTLASSATPSSSEDCFLTKEGPHTLCVDKCKKNNNVRLIQTDEESCDDGEMPMPWSQPSPFVPSIITIAGESLTMRDPGENCAPVHAYCPPGYAATGGGWLRTDGDMEANVAYDGPIVDGVETPIGWQVRLEAEGGGTHMTFQAFVHCIGFAAVEV